MYPLYWPPANGFFYHHPCYWPQNILPWVGWGVGLRHQLLRWRSFESHSNHFVDIAIKSIVSFTLNTFKWYLLPSSILLEFLYKVLFPVIWTPVDGIYYHHEGYSPYNIQAEWPTGMRPWLKAQVTPVAWVQVLHLIFFDNPEESIVPLILNACKSCHLPLSMLLTTKHTNKIDEWSKVLVNCTSHFGGVGFSPTPVILLTLLCKVLFSLFWTPAHGIFYHHPCCWPQNIQAGWPSGLRP